MSFSITVSDLNIFSPRLDARLTPVFINDNLDSLQFYLANLIITIPDTKQ